MMGACVNNSRVTVAAGFTALAAAYFLVAPGCPGWVRICLKLLPDMFLAAALVSTMRRCSDRALVLTAISALLFSLAGDALGELKRGLWGEYAFVFQIGAFAVAQILYAASFLRFVSLGRVGVRRILYVMLLLAYFIVMGVLLLPNVDSVGLKFAVTIYMCLLAAMSMTAVLQTRPGYACFASGAVLFVISDSMIAVGMFLGSFPHRGFLIMLTYFAAQLLLNINLITPYYYD